MDAILRHKSVTAAVLILCAALLTSGCGGGGGGLPPIWTTGQVAFGPLEGAQLEIFEVKADGTFPLIHTQTTSGGAGVANVGYFNPVPVPLSPTALYLFKATGGNDVDADDDGILDTVPTPMLGSVHALVLGSQAAFGHLKLNALTEILYRRVYYMLVARYTQAEIVAALDELTLLLLESDVDGNGVINTADALRWSPATGLSALRKDAAHFDNLSIALRDGDHGWTAWEAESLSDTSVAFEYFDQRVQDVHVVGNRAYVALEDAGFAILDVSDPRKPIVLGSVLTLGEGEDMAVQGDFVYFSRRDDGPMQIYDVSNPAAPTPRGSVPMDTPDCLYPDGNLLFAVDRHTNSIRILDITDPDAPFEITSIATYDDPNEVDRAGDYLYVAEESYLTVLDISDPANPFIRASIDAYDDVDGVKVVGNYAYCADGLAGLLVVDVSDLDNLQVVANLPSRNECDHVWIQGNTLYMSARHSGVQVVDITTPTAPVLLGYCTVATDAREAVTSGGYTYVAGAGGGLRVIDQAEPPEVLFAELTDDLVLGTVATGTGNQDVVASGNYAYIAKDNGLTIVNIADPTNPTVVRTDTFAAGDSESITMQGNMLYLATEGGGLQLVDVTDPLNPDVKPPFPLSDEAQDVAVQGNYAYVADRYGSEFIVVDVTNPDAPAWVGDVRTLVGDSARAVAVQGNWAYVAWGYTGLVSVNITDPTNPTIEDIIELHDVGSVDPDFAHKLALSGNYAAVIAEELHIISIADPYNLSFIDTYEISRDENIAIHSDFAFVVEGVDGVTVVNVFDPANPWTVEQVPTLGDSRAAYVHNGLLLVVNRDEGLTILNAPFGTNIP